MRSRPIIVPLAGVAVFLLVVGVIVAMNLNRAGRLAAVPAPPGATSRLPENEQYETRVDLLAMAMGHGLEERFGTARSTAYVMPRATDPAQVVSFVERSLGGDWRRFAPRCRLRGHPVDVPGRRFITSCRWVEESRWWPRAVEVAVFDRLDASPPSYWPGVLTVVIATSRGR